MTLLKVCSGKLIHKKTWIEKTEVVLKPLTRDEIGLYLRRINPLDKAGGYAIQSRAMNIVSRIHGSYANAVGLPVETLTKALAGPFFFLPLTYSHS